MGGHRLLFGDKTSGKRSDCRIPGNFELRLHIRSVRGGGSMGGLYVLFPRSRGIALKIALKIVSLTAKP